MCPPMRHGEACAGAWRSRSRMAAAPLAVAIGPTRPLAARASRLTQLASPGAQASFARFWRAWLAEKRPYLTDGALEDLETHGRKRLLPHLAHLPLGEITERHVRDWLHAMTEQHRGMGLAGSGIAAATSVPPPGGISTWKRPSRGETRSASRQDRST